MPSILFITRGCAKNEVDTDRMRALLLGAGYDETDDPDKADLALINTCSFLVSATQESLDTTLEIAQQEEDGGRTLPIVMCGCVPSRYGAPLADELPEVSAFVNADDEDGIVSVVDDVLGLERDVAPGVPQGVLRTVDGASAYVKISEGCDRFCAFCAIPYIRGRYHSRDAREICDEVRSLMEGGVREVVLIGQDTGIWGSDLDEPRTLASLLRQVAEVVHPYGGWVRVLYLQPEGMTEELVSTIRDVPEVLPYIDIPIQHCSATVLERMGRKGSAEEFFALFAPAQRDSCMVLHDGHGWSSRARRMRGRRSCLTSFRMRSSTTAPCLPTRPEGTRGAAMPDQVPEEVKLERTQRLIDLTEQLGFAAAERHVGECVRVIIDGVEEGPDGAEFIGHAWFQAPDSDGVVHIESGDLAVGDVVTCNLVDSFTYDLVGELVDDEEGTR